MLNVQVNQNAPPFKLRVTFETKTSAAQVVLVEPSPQALVRLSHVLKGDKGEAGGQLSAVCAQALSGHVACVYLSNGQIVAVDVANRAHAQGLAGITKNAAVAGDVCELLFNGHLHHAGWQFDAGKPVFIGLNGVLTQTPAMPPLAVWRRCVGVAMDATTVAIDFQPALFFEE